jgi:hypothetical protein
MYFDKERNMSCNHLPKPSRAWWNCILTPEGDAEDSMDVGPGDGSTPFTWKLLDCLTEAQLTDRPQTILYLLQALYYDDNDYEKVVQIGSNLDELITHDTALHKEIRAQCDVLYVHSHEKLHGAIY